MTVKVFCAKITTLILLAFLITPVFAETFCQYASSAEATSELTGYEAKYATGRPNSDLKCSTTPIIYASWEKENWNTTAQIIFTFKKPIYPENITIFGDYDLCVNKVWVLRENEWYLVKKGVVEREREPDCTINYDFGVLNFRTNKIKVEPCSWSWSAIDAIQFCGSEKSFPKIDIVDPVQDAIIDDSSKKLTMKISTDILSECELSFSKEFDFGEGLEMLTDDGLIHIYEMSKPVTMNSMSVYYKCRGENGKINSYSVMHRFNFREEEIPFIEICNWYNCSEGAASISDDDGYHITLGRVDAVCSEELEKRGLKGTYFLAFTDQYNESDWELVREAYEYGHEIGGHTLYHQCLYDMNETFFREDKEKNIEDILEGVGMPKEELITFAWPCGITLPEYKEWLSDYYLFARGYHKNLMESKNPDNYLDYRSFNYKSFNSIGFGEVPPDYYLLADVTENYQDWINYVYHDSCDNPEMFDYLIEKDLWIETIGTISKYIAQRNSVSTENIVQGEDKIEFDLISPLDIKIFDRELSLSLYLGNQTLEKIIVSGVETNFVKFKKGNKDYIKFNVPARKVNHIEIVGLSSEVPYCGDGKVDIGREECDDGNNLDGDDCSSTCQLEISGSVYIISYIGNIDGSANKEWYYFFDNLTSYYEENEIPVAFSFFPDSIKSNNYQFSEIFKRMYLAENIELMQKGYKMDEYEKHLDEFPAEIQRYIIEEGRHTYLNKMGDILRQDFEEIDFPVTYVAPYGRMTTTTRRVLEEAGFRVNFGVYYVDELGPVEPTANLDMYQYAVSFTESGRAGRDTIFKDPDEIIKEVLSYNRVDLPITKINGKRIVPLYVHQPDFEHSTENNVVDKEKWAIYTETIERLNENPNITFVTPYEAWKLRHPVCVPTGVTEAACNRIDDDCDGEIDEECNIYDYFNNFSFSEYNLSSEYDSVDLEYYRDYFKKDSTMDRVSRFVYTIYDWIVYSINDLIYTLERIEF